MKKHIWLVLLILIFALSGCNKVDFTLTKTTYELYVNESIDLEYQTKTSNLKIEIKIEDETIASANEVTIKGLSAGETKAKVVVNEKEQKQEITIIVSEVPYLRVEPESKNTTREEELALNLVTNISNPVYTYTSSNPSVASVNSQGVIHTHTYGNALITVHEANTNLTVTFEVFVSEAKVLVLETADYNLLTEYLNSFQEGDILILQGELEFTEELEFSNLTFILRGKLIAPRMTFNNVSLVGEKGSLESEDIKVSGNTTFKNIRSTSNLNIDSGSILLEDSDLGNVYLNNGGITLINKGSLNQIDFTNIASLEDDINIVNYGTIKETNDALVLSDLINKDNLFFDNKGEYFTFKEKNYLNKDLLVNGKKRTIYQDGYNLDTVYLSDISSSIRDTLTDFWLLESARKVVISTNNYGLKVSDLNLIKESVLELESLDLSEATLANNMIASSQFAGLSSLKEIILPNNLNTISSNAFTGTGIEAIRIPDSVKQVEEDAFGNYKAGPVTLFEVHLESLVPKGEEFVYGFSPFTRFFVSAPHVDKYQNEWGQYSVTIPYLDYRKVYYNNYIFREATRYGDYYLSPINFTEIEIVYYAGEVKEDLIPNTYVLEKEYKVTRIGENAFRDTVKNGLAIELVMPDNVREICDYAFNGFGTISKLDLNNVKRVGKYAFQNIDYTFTVIDAPNLTQLWDYAFEGLSLVTAINFPNIYHIGEYAISGMRSLERVYAPKLQHLSNGSLVNNDSLVEIVLGPVVECGSFTITAPKKARVWDFTHSEIDKTTGLVRVVEPHFGTAWNTNTKAIDTVYCNMDVVEYFKSKLPNATVIGR